MYQNNLGNMYVRNVSPIRFWNIRQTHVSDLGWKQKRRFTIPILNNFVRVRLLPQSFRYLPPLSTKQKPSQISYRSEFQIASHLNNAASKFSKERRGKGTAKMVKYFIGLTYS